MRNNDNLGTKPYAWSRNWRSGTNLTTLGNRGLKINQKARKTIVKQLPARRPRAAADPLPSARCPEAVFYWFCLLFD